MATRAAWLPCGAVSLALGVTGPLAGLVAGATGVGGVYLAAAVTVALSWLVAWRLLLLPLPRSHGG